MEPNQHNNNHLSKASGSTQGRDMPQLNGQYELILNWYKVNGKNLLGEETLSDLHIQTLLKILGNPIWNQIYHCWAVELKHMPDLQPYAKHTFDPTKFVYFIEAYNNN